ncbi:MAG: acetyl-CoA C-acetyltransferase [Chromatiales bacterium]|nr:acetyl-CoA C-acetyltransferase [Chromatiales bacterium]
MLHGQPRRVAIVGSLRIPFCRARTRYAEASNQEMMTAVLSGLVERYGLKRQRLGDVSLGAVMKHSRDWNLARECVLGSGLSEETPAFDLQRACGTSLEAALQIGNKIALGQIEAGIAGGSDSISDVPLVYPDDYRRLLMRSLTGRSLGQRLRPWLGLRPRHFRPVAPDVTEPRTGLSMGQSTELTARHFGISREDQDALALASHQSASRAWEEGFYSDLVLPFAGADRDNNVRADTSAEKLAALPTVFSRDEQATLTAGNSSPLTDGAAAVLLASEEWAQERQLPVLAWLRYGKVAAVDFAGRDRDSLLMAPAHAIASMLKDMRMDLQDFDFYEIHEAFAAQALATLRALESADFCRKRLGLAEPLGAIDRSRLNTRGGSIALGHPFAATGARIIGSLAKLLAGRGHGRGLISVCTAGGMGVTAILERD